MLEIILFLVLGIFVGVIMGLVPGIHPNMVVLFVPLLLGLDAGVFPLVAFVVAMGVTNTFVDFIPSIFLGAGEGGKELAVLPGHRMLLARDGYSAVKISVAGALGASIILSFLLPAVIFAVPFVYAAAESYIHFLLLFFSLVIIASDSVKKTAVSAAVFAGAGFLGTMLSTVPVSEVFVLFPVFSGFFGASVLILELRNKVKVPKQKISKTFMSRRSLNRAVVSGTLGGVAAGFLPGVGSSEIGALASVQKDGKSFLATLGAISSANIILSVLSLWLISKSRSGVAVAVGQITHVGFVEALFVIAVFLVCAGVASAITLTLAKRAALSIHKINYSLLSKSVIVLIVVLTVLFTGLLGVLILAVCTAMGVFVNMYGIKRSALMAVLIVPTMLFYAGA